MFVAHRSADRYRLIERRCMWQAPSISDLYTFYGQTGAIAHCNVALISLGHFIREMLFTSFTPVFLANFKV